MQKIGAVINKKYKNKYVECSIIKKWSILLDIVELPFMKLRGGAEKSINSNADAVGGG